MEGKESDDVILDNESITLPCFYNRMEALNRQQHLFWRNKAKAAWIEGGDKNTKYFHSLIKNWKCKNFIHSVVDNDGHQLTEQKDIAACSVN